MEKQECCFDCFMICSFNNMVVPSMNRFISRRSSLIFKDESWPLKSHYAVAKNIWWGNTSPQWKCLPLNYLNIPSYSIVMLFMSLRHAGDMVLYLHLWHMRDKFVNIMQANDFFPRSLQSTVFGWAGTNHSSWNKPIPAFIGDLTLRPLYW